MAKADTARQASITAIKCKTPTGQRPEHPTILLVWSAMHQVVSLFAPVRCRNVFREFFIFSKAQRELETDALAAQRSLIDRTAAKLQQSGGLASSMFIAALLTGIIVVAHTVPAALVILARFLIEITILATVCFWVYLNLRRPPVRHATERWERFLDWLIVTKRVSVRSLENAVASGLLFYESLQVVIGGFGAFVFAALCAHFPIARVWALVLTQRWDALAMAPRGVRITALFAAAWVFAYFLTISVPISCLKAVRVAIRARKKDFKIGNG